MAEESTEQTRGSEIRRSAHVPVLALFYEVTLTFHGFLACNAALVFHVDGMRSGLVETG